MDPSAYNPFDPTADEFTPIYSPFTTSISSFSSQNGNTMHSKPKNALATGNMGSYGLSSHSSKFQYSNAYQQSDTYHRSSTYQQSSSYQHFSPTLQVDRGMVQHGPHQHPHLVAPMALPLHRPFQQRNRQYTTNEPGSHRSVQYGNHYSQGVPMNRSFYGLPEQSHPYQQFAPPMQTNRGIAHYSSHPHQAAPTDQLFHGPVRHRSPCCSAAPVVQASSPFGQIPDPLFQNPVPVSNGRDPRNNAALHRCTPVITPCTSITTSAGRETPPKTPASTLDGDGSVIPEITKSVNNASRAKKPKKRENDPLNPEDILPGSIVWLAVYKNGHEPILCVKNHDCNDPEKEKEGRNHPVVILQIHQRHGSNVIGDLVCDVAIMTTLSRLGIGSYLHKLRTIGRNESAEWFLKRTLPLSWQPLKKEELSDEELQKAQKTEKYLEDKHGPELQKRGNGLLSLSSGTMQKRSYVRVQHTYAVPLKQLLACSLFAKKAWMVRLDKDSYRTVMRSLGLKPGPWECNWRRSVATGPERLRRLRDEEMARFHALEHDATISSPSTRVNHKI